MKINFAGPFTTIDPIIIPFTTPGTFTFDKTAYPDHIFYDVIVIGAGGGWAGGMEGEDPSQPGNIVKNFGGAGGGGGFHRRQGLLELLADSTTVIVGAAGADGADGPDESTPADDAEDGGYSSFGSFVMATGGKGGKGSQTVDSNESQLADGGDGGIGGTLDILVGGGGKGGVCGSTAGETGKLITTGRFYIPDTDTYTAKGWVGKGGGGGPGGSYFQDAMGYQLQAPFALAGGKGTYNSDEEVYDPGSGPRIYVPEPGINMKAKPGRGGGARVTPLTRTNAVYGGTGANGCVFIRLSVV